MPFHEDNSIYEEGKSSIEWHTQEIKTDKICGTNEVSYFDHQYPDGMSERVYVLHPDKETTNKMNMLEITITDSLIYNALSKHYEIFESKKQELGLENYQHSLSIMRFSIGGYGITGKYLIVQITDYDYSKQAITCKIKYEIDEKSRVIKHPSVERFEETEDTTELEKIIMNYKSEERAKTQEK